jgi:phytoene dehydrogenase-like protein
MIRAVVKNGTIHPLEAIPSEWSEGCEVVVDVEPRSRPAEIDRWYEELQAAAADIDPDDDERLQDAVSEVRKQAKQVARLEMGLG